MHVLASLHTDQPIYFQTLALTQPTLFTPICVASSCLILL
jgi:hypothetical protein